ncbi:MAG: glycosyltransferase [Actinobacteria bacterium]|nr:MAG: glycosyltransferase [Actinomycetota bacterium]
MVQPLETRSATRPTERLRVLSLVPFTPRSDGRHGGSRVIGQFLAHLALRHDVAVLHARWPGEAPVDETLRARCAAVEEVVEPRADRSLGARVARRARMRYALLHGTPTWVQHRRATGYGEQLESLVRTWEPDVIQFEFHVTAQFLPNVATCRAPKVLVEHEPGIATATQKGRQNRGRVLRQLEVRAWRRFETAVTQEVDAVVAFTERDRTELERIAGDTKVVKIPLGIDIPEQPSDPLGSDPSDLLFFGSFRHEPNVDAAVRLARTIFPLVRARRPQATLHIVGAEPSPAVERLAGQGVFVVGEVPDLSPYLERAAAIVLPLRFGSGMRVKVLEALAAGKAVIGTRLAFEGIDVVDRKHVVVAESDEAFASAAVDLLANPPARASLAEQARSWAEQNLSWESRIDAYDRLYASLLERAVAGSPAS